jgi:hypothetical protein
MCLVKTLNLNKEQIKKLPKSKEKKYEYCINNIFQIAKKDIKVYKILSLENRTPYQNFLIEKNTHYYQTDKKFSISIETFRNWRELLPNTKLEVDEGLHAYLKHPKNSWYYGNRNKVVKAIIPKGSLYLINNGNTEIVSDNLIFYDLNHVKN